MNEIGKKDKNLTAKDIYLLQEDIKNKIDIEKPKDEMSAEELAQMAIYETLDNALEEVMGKEAKKDLDEKRDIAEKTAVFGDAVIQIINTGKEIEKNLAYEYAYFVNHFEKNEDNNIYMTIENVSTVLVQDKSLNNSERMAKAKQLLELMDAYETAVTEKILSHHDIYESLLKSVREKFQTLDFSHWNKSDVAKESQNMANLESNLERWLELTEQLVPYRKKALEAIKYDLKKDRVIPNMIIENDGDPNATTSSSEMLIAADNMVKLTQEAGDFEEKVTPERQKLVEAIFGEINLGTPDYVQKNKESRETKSDPLVKKKWYRAYRVLNIIAHIVGIGIALILWSVSFKAFAITLGIVLLILWGIKKAVRYIALG